MREGPSQLTAAAGPAPMYQPKFPLRHSKGMLRVAIDSTCTPAYTVTPCCAAHALRIAGMAAAKIAPYC